MKQNTSKRKRCSECRQWFHPAWSALETQVVCGPGCRAARRLRLARLRRGREVQDYRVDERRRQRECRRRRREKADPVACHAPASPLIPAELKQNVLEIWDIAAAVSRATLARRLPTALRRWMPSAGTMQGLRDPLSRAGLIVQPIEVTGG